MAPILDRFQIAGHIRFVKMKPFAGRKPVLFPE